MFKWIPYELHTHTNHSDGKQTIQELSARAKDLGLKGFAITDHNTISTFKDLEEMSHRYNMDIIKGMEWTTFYGHILLLGIENYIEWRDVTLNNINEKITNIRNQAALIGIAHPYAIGGPISTGSYFEYEIEDWNKIDYIEVWSGLLPGNKTVNKKAFNRWTELLNQGYKLAAVAGRDWHDSKESDKYISCTYLGSDGKTEEIADPIRAIKNGRISVGCGYMLDMSLCLNEEKYYIGDLINKNDRDKLNIILDFNIIKSEIDCKCAYDLENLVLKVVSNNGEEKKLSVKDSIIHVELKGENIEWIRGELYVTLEEVMVAFTNPIYFI